MFFSNSRPLYPFTNADVFLLLQAFAHRYNINTASNDSFGINIRPSARFLSPISAGHAGHVYGKIKIFNRNTRNVSRAVDPLSKILGEDCNFVKIFGIHFCVTFSISLH